MEYIDQNGVKAIVEGDMVSYGTGSMKKQVIGPNFANGMKLGGRLSSFGGSFTDEIIGIESGLGDIVNVKLGNVSEAYSMLREKMANIDNNNFFEVSKAVLETVDEYFGGIANVANRMNYYYSEDYEESKDNRISNLKGTGAAMCVERAALAQNLLKSLRINSFYKSSGIIKDNNKEAHSFNVVEFNEKYYIFDATMPNMIDGEVSPLICEIDREAFDLITTPLSYIGCSVSVSHYNPYRNKDINVTYDSGRIHRVAAQPLTESNGLKL